jgi:dienelactone hydrolase
MIFDERKRLEQEDGEPLHVVRMTPDFAAAQQMKLAGVVVVAGERGLTGDDEARFVRPLAELGFFVVGVDLVKERASLTRAIALHDLAAALLYLREMAGGKLGVLAYEAGAAIAIEAATTLPQIDAVVAAACGPLPKLPLSRTRSSIQLHRGSDSTIDVAELHRAIQPARQNLFPFDYPVPDRFFAHPLDEDERFHATVAMDRARDFLVQTLT